MKRILSLTITIAVFILLLPVIPAAAEDYATGLIHDSEETIQEHLIDYGPSYETTLPSSVDLTDEFPAPGNQGSQNSCIGWAVAYALKSHQEETARHWGLDTDEHLFSPSYIYNQLCRGSDNGIALAPALDLIKEQGVCTLASFPYNARDYVTQPTEEQRNEAALYAASAWHTIHGTDSIKKRLSEGDGVIIAIDLYPDFYNISEADPVYDILYGSVKGYHAVCLVGYDDNKQCYGGVKGAFKFINSWGTSWGVDGYGWISYDMLSYGEVGRGYGYIVDAGEPLYYESDFQYAVKDGEAEIKRYIGSGGDVEIPEMMGGYTVTKISCC